MILSQRETTIAMHSYKHSQSKNNFKIWSKLGMRASFGIIAQEISQKEKNLIILTADVSTSAGLDRFKKKFPEKYK